jgi:molecular chaperone GrpE
MSDKKEDDSVQIKSTDENAADQGESITENDPIQAEEKPIEEITKEELIEKLGQLQEKVDENYDKFLRSQAETDNIIKRNKKEKEDWIKYANETLIKELLPVVDNLEKAIAFTDNKRSLDALKEGVELTLKNLKDTLTKSGLEEVDAQGKPFDPAYHHAVSEQDAEDMEAGHVLQELQKGYMLHQRLIRPAMVILSKGPS